MDARYPGSIYIVQKKKIKTSPAHEPGMFLFGGVSPLQLSYFSVINAIADPTK